MRSACSSLDRCVPRAAHVSGISVLADVLRVLVAARRPTVIVLAHPFGSCVTKLKISFQRPSQALSCGDALADGPRDSNNFYALSRSTGTEDGLGHEKQAYEPRAARHRAASRDRETTSH